MYSKKNNLAFRHLKNDMICKKMPILTFGFIIALTISTFASCKDEPLTKPADKPIVKPTDSLTYSTDNISSVKLVKLFKVGWNLGNTLDAWGGGSKDPLISETSWNNPVTTKQMIDSVKAAGFNVLRIPVTWQNHFDATTFQIDKAWMDRIQTVVNYGIDNKMFVVLNMHHDNWIYPTYDKYPTISTKFKSLWSQIADRFADYNEFLIFEAMNEPRLIGTELEWGGGNTEARSVINMLNADFIKTIRDKGGKNKLRHLMIPSYACGTADRVLSALEIPKDDKIIISVHSYSPYNFALTMPGGTEFNSANAADIAEINSTIVNIRNYFVSKNIAVVIGEMGSRDKNNLAARVDHAYYFIKTATSAGIPCFWWDDGISAFGILNRHAVKWEHPLILDAIMRGAAK